MLVADTVLPYKRPAMMIKLVDAIVTRLASVSTLVNVTSQC